MPQSRFSYGSRFAQAGAPFFRFGASFNSRAIALGVVLTVSACAGGAVPPVATGPWTALNANKWTPTQAEIDWLSQ